MSFVPQLHYFLQTLIFPGLSVYLSSLALIIHFFFYLSLPQYFFHTLDAFNLHQSLPHSIIKLTLGNKLLKKS